MKLVPTRVNRASARVPMLRARAQMAVGLALGVLAVAGVIDVIAAKDAVFSGAYIAAIGAILLAAGLAYVLRARGSFTVMSTLLLSIATAVVAARFLAERNGVLDAIPGGFRVSAVSALAGNLLLVGLGLWVGWLVAGVVRTPAAEEPPQERRLRALLDLAADWYWEQDEQLRFSFVDARIESQLGVRCADLLGRVPWDVEDFALSNDQWTAFRADLDARRPLRNFIIERQSADGTRTSVSLTGEPIFDRHGAFRGYWGVARDVTADHEARRALARSEQRYRDLFEHSPSALVLHRGGRILKANDAAATLFRFKDSAAMVGNSMLDLYAHGDQTRVAKRIAQLEEMSPGEALPSTEIQLVTRDGAEVFALGTGIRADTGEGAATLSVYFDVTDRKRDRDALRRSEEMLSRLFDASPDVIIVSERGSGRLAMVNERYTKLFGFTRAEAIGHSSEALGLWPKPQERAALIEALARDGVVHGMPVTRRTRDGRLLSMLYSAARMNVDGMDYMIGTIRDVTEQERLRREYEAILKHASVGIAFTRERVFRLVNPRFEQMLGWEPDSLAGQAGTVVWPSLKDYETVGNLIGPKLAYGETVDFEWTLRNRDGTQLLARIRARAIDEAQPAAGGTIWIVEDITERRAFELALADAKDAAESANRAKSAFLANMSHELRTPLNGVIGLARLALDPNLPPGKKDQYLQGVIDSAQTLTRIVSDILDLSKIEAGKLAIEDDDFDLHALLDAIEVTYSQLATEKGLQFAVQRSGDVPRFVRGDALRVRQILGNFLSNALKFTSRGRIALSVERVDKGLRMAVRDTGIGIDVRTQGRLFARFTQADASTTRRFGGTGLGLSICRQLAYLMKGEVGVESQPGAGSTFWAILPLPGAMAPVPVGAQVDGGDLAGMHVLLVEDNEVNMLIADAVLKSWGIMVEQATDGRAAIDAVERAFECGKPFDAVLMDVQMPVMSGYEATAALRQRYDKRRLPIIALTAAVLTTEQDQSQALGMNDFVAKPIDEPQLQAALARVRPAAVRSMHS